MIDPNPASELAYLRREVTRLKRILAAVSILAVTLPLLAAQVREEPSVLRVKGLVVVDEAGRDRILIGAPIPPSPGRVRENPERAKAAYGGRFPDMEWFSKLDHETNGIVILDANGHDRLALGDPVPDPTLGKRIAPGTGIMINDEQGDERGGWGYFQALGRIGFGLDHKDGEGVNLFVLEDGTSGLLAQGRGGARATFLGVAVKDSLATSLASDFAGLLVRDSAPRLLAGLDAQGAALELREDGKPALRLPE